MRCAVLCLPLLAPLSSVLFPLSSVLPRNVLGLPEIWDNRVLYPSYVLSQGKARKLVCAARAFGAGRTLRKQTPQKRPVVPSPNKPERLNQHPPFLTPVFCSLPSVLPHPLSLSPKRREKGFLRGDRERRGEHRTDKNTEILHAENFVKINPFKRKTPRPLHG